MTFLIFQSAPARTWIVASNLCWTCWPCCCCDRSACCATRPSAVSPCSISSGSAFAGVAFGPFFGGVAFGLAAGFGDLVNVGAHVARSFALWFGPLDRDGEVVAQEFEQRVYDVMLNGLLEVIEHTEGFVFELDERITLPNRAETDTCSHHIQRVDVIHPETVNDLEGVGAFQVTNGEDS